jgi:hypothetical protein
MLTALRGALDPRVCVASARALWDCVGKELFEFVDALQVGEALPPSGYHSRFCPLH